jgi:hypothetical protein
MLTDVIEKLVVPVIMLLADPESIDDFRTDAVMVSVLQTVEL